MSPLTQARRTISWADRMWSGSVVRMNRSGVIDRAASAATNSSTIESTIYVAVYPGPADHLLGGPDVVRIRRPDEPVGRDRQGRFGRHEQLDHRVDELCRRLPRPGGPSPGRTGCGPDPSSG